MRDQKKGTCEPTARTIQMQEIAKQTQRASRQISGLKKHACRQNHRKQTYAAQQEKSLIPGVIFQPVCEQCLSLPEDLKWNPDRP